MNTIVILRYIHRILPFIRQLNAILGAPSSRWMVWPTEMMVWPQKIVVWPGKMMMISWCGVNGMPYYHQTWWWNMAMMNPMFSRKSWWHHAWRWLLNQENIRLFLCFSHHHGAEKAGCLVPGCRPPPARWLSSPLAAAGRFARRFSRSSATSRMLGKQPGNTMKNADEYYTSV